MGAAAKLSEILLVDDDEADNFLHARVIRRFGCTERVTTFQDSELALAYLATEVDGGVPVPDLIFLDINMPKIDGWNFLSRYEKLDVPKSIVIVMLTASLNPDDAQRAEGLGHLTDFLNKPLTPQRLREILEEHFPARDWG